MRVQSADLKHFALIANPPQSPKKELIAPVNTFYPCINPPKLSIAHALLETPASNFVVIPKLTSFYEVPMRHIVAVVVLHKMILFYI